MNLAVLTKQVPDLVEGLEIDATGKALDPASLRFLLSEADDHALEQALLLKERHGGRVEVFALDIGEAREALTTALAKGADRAVQVRAGLDGATDSHTAAGFFAALLRGQAYDLILTGVRAIDDLDGSLGGMLAATLGLPYVGLVRKVVAADGTRSILVQKEYPGGYAAELEVVLPAVLGIQAAEQPPRYVPISRLRAVMKTSKVEECDAAPAAAPALQIERLFKPDEGAGATILSGTPEELAHQFVGVLVERRVLR